MKKLLSVLLVLTLMAGLAACGNEAASETAAAPAVSETAENAESAPAEEAPEEDPAAEEPSAAEHEDVVEHAYEAVDISIGAMTGPTGAGLVKLMDDAAQGLTENHYEITLAAEASEVVSKVIAGEYDIACLPTNAAATVYNKTQGKVNLLALNTAGVLHIMQNSISDDPITAWEDLKGKTIYSVGQGANPEYILDFVLSQHGIDPDKDVTIEFCAAATDVIAACVSGEAEICMLPEPAVSTLNAKIDSFKKVLDMTEGWNESVEDGSILTQGCVVVQKAFLEEHPEAVKKFLEEYEASINYVNENQEAAAALLVQYEIVNQESVALHAIPGCHIMFMSGQEMKDSIGGFYQVLFDADPTSIGGAIPDENFYYLGA